MPPPNEPTDGPRVPDEIFATRAGTLPLRASQALGALGLAAFLGPFPVVWISRMLAPDNALYHAFRGPLGVFMLFVVAPLFTLTGAALRRRVLGGPARVTVVDGALVIARGERETRVALTDLVDGIVVPMKRTARLELRRRSGEALAVEVPVDDVAALERLLDAAGIGPDRRRLRTRIGGWTTPVYRALFATIVLVFTVIPLLRGVLPKSAEPPDVGEILLRTAIMGGLALAGWLLASLSLGPEVVVGTDGITVRRLAARRFIAHDEISSLGVIAGGVTARLKDGTAVSLGRSRDAAHAQALARHIERAARAPRSPETSARAELLDRRGRTLEAWRAELAAIARAPVGYRAATLDRDDLATVLADADAPVDRRLGAALALGASGEPAAAQRIRVVADACADEPLRVALERIADGDVREDDVEAAVARQKRA